MWWDDDDKVGSSEKMARNQREIEKAEREK